MSNDSHIHTYISLRIIQVHNTGRKLSSLESIPLPTSLEELRDVSQQLACIAESLLIHQEHQPISSALQDLSVLVQGQIERAVDLNDRLCVTT